MLPLPIEECVHSVCLYCHTLRKHFFPNPSKTPNSNHEKTQQQAKPKWKVVYTTWPMCLQMGEWIKYEEIRKPSWRPIRHKDRPPCMTEARTLDQKRASVEEMVEWMTAVVNSHAQMLLWSFHNGLELPKTLALGEPYKQHKRTLWIVFALS